MSEEFWFQPTEDSMYRACMKINDVTACCTVSSMHLIEEKRSQLREACLRDVDS